MMSTFPKATKLSSIIPSPLKIRGRCASSIISSTYFCRSTGKLYQNESYEMHPYRRKASLVNDPTRQHKNTLTAMKRMLMRTMNIWMSFVLIAWWIDKLMNKWIGLILYLPHPLQNEGRAWYAEGSSYHLKKGYWTQYFGAQFEDAVAKRNF